ncbi:MAG: glycosyltransferase family 39 protein [Candidatus Aminicenantes bacterium]|nr:MAG: glycosyltransferase family 39 protein [Candidatus Aminicenantes bacterium]
MKWNNKKILIILLFFLSIRIGVAVFMGQKDLAGDSPGYNSYATTILQRTNWITDFTGSSRSPFYPMFIAAIYAIFGMNNYLSVFLFQAFLSVFTCFYIYKLGKKIFNEKIAVLSLIWSGFYIFYLKYVRLLLRETLIFFLIIIFFYYLYLFLIDENRKTRNFSLILLFYFLLIHTDPKYLFYLPFFISLFAIYQPFKQGVKKYLVFLLMTVLLMIPWTVRNYIAYDKIVLINPETEALFKYNTSTIYLSIFYLGQIDVSMPDKNPTEEERRMIKSGLNPYNRMKEEISAIKKDIYPPTTFFGRKWWYFKEFWRPFRFKGEYRPFPLGKFVLWSFKHNLSSIICYGVLIPFMVLAVIVLFKRKIKAVWFLLFPLFLQCLLHVILWSLDRFRNPIDAFIIILGSFGIIFSLNFIFEKLNMGKVASKIKPI